MTRYLQGQKATVVDRVLQKGSLDTLEWLDDYLEDFIPAKCELSAKQRWCTGLHLHLPSVRLTLDLNGIQTTIEP